MGGGVVQFIFLNQCPESNLFFAYYYPLWDNNEMSFFCFDFQTRKKDECLENHVLAARRPV